MREVECIRTRSASICLLDVGPVLDSGVGLRRGITPGSKLRSMLISDSLPALVSNDPARTDTAE